MRRAYVGIGSNIEPLHNLPTAVGLLARLTRLRGISTVYRSPALDRPGDPPFLNAVAEVHTQLPAPILRAGVLARIEEWLGRERGADSYAPRTLDLDLLIEGALATNDPPTSQPHRDIRDRPFVAIPLLELAGDLDFPQWNERLSNIVERLSTQGISPVPGLSRALRRQLLDRPPQEQPQWKTQPTCSHAGPRPRPRTRSEWNARRGSRSRQAST